MKNSNDMDHRGIPENTRPEEHPSRAALPQALPAEAAALKRLRHGNIILRHGGLRRRGAPWRGVVEMTRNLAGKARNVV